LNHAGLRALSLWSGETFKPSRCQRHFGGSLKSSLNTRNGAVFFSGVSQPRLDISISALLFFVPSKSDNHARFNGGSLHYQVWAGAGHLSFYSSWRCSGQSVSVALFRCCPSGWHSRFQCNGTTKSLSRSLRSLGRA